MDYQAILAAVEGPSQEGRAQSQKQFSLTQNPAMRWLGLPFGLFLCYSIARVPEQYPVFDIPRLPLILAAIMLPFVVFGTPFEAWKTFWDRAPVFRAMLGLLALALLTMPIGIWMGGSFWFFKSKFLVQWCAFLIAMILFRDRQILRQSLAVLILVVAAEAYSAIQGKTTAMAAEAEGLTRVSIGHSIDPNDFATILVTLIPLALWLGNRGGWRRFWWTAVALLMFSAIIPTASRGGLLGICAVALVMILQGTSGSRRLVMAGLVGGGALLFSLLVSDAQLARFTGITGDTYNQSNGEGRIAIWKRGVYWTVKRPTGYGLGNFPVYFSWLNGPERSSHNSLVQIAVELGVAGLALFLFIFWSAIKRGKAMRRVALLPRNRGDPSTREEATLAGYILAALAGMFVTGFFLANAYDGLTMVMFGVVAGTQLIAPDRPPAHAAAGAKVPTRHRTPPLPR
ncbi:MAG: O-antigen ligase family protein [Gemmatimonadales bacterium]